ncbi:uncharacterized protein LOC133286777 [Gastrolobium bilobum]|uniref:uncharacterized protein LOC133286777 n=1 Tax=Gastrolobium bilobum TaxID=150636 RepID=UPI002AB1F619|nr:uncharacterized protein LOC133286777 [Gastrolobium bilobum]
MRSNRLHNFTFPSPFLKWGTQWIMRPTNADGTGGISGSGDNKRKRSSVSMVKESTATHKKELEPKKKHATNARVLKRRRSIKVEDEIVSGRKKLMLDVKNEEKEPVNGEGLKEPLNGKGLKEPVRPWNLRNRRTEYKGDTSKRSTRTRGAPTWAKDYSTDIK